MDDISLPEDIDDSMQVDGPTPLEPSGSDANDRLDEMLSVAEGAFFNFVGGQSFLRRFNREVFRRMCQRRNLEDTGTKNQMWVRLSTWVSLREAIGR